MQNILLFPTNSTVRNNAKRKQSAWVLGLPWLFRLFETYGQTFWFLPIDAAVAQDTNPKTTSRTELKQSEYFFFLIGELRQK